MSDDQEIRRKKAMAKAMARVTAGLENLSTEDLEAIGDYELKLVVHPKVPSNRPPRIEAVLEEPVPQDDPFLLTKTDVWVHKILPFLGPGHFVFVALVCRRFKELYLEFFSKLKDPPTILWPGTIRECRAVPTTTLYSATFFSVPRAEFWNRIDMGRSNRLRDGSVCSTIARRGTVEVLIWARQKGFEWDQYTCHYAASNGNLKVLKYLHENQCPWNEATCVHAAGNGHLECLRYAHENGCQGSARACSEAAKGGHLEVLKYARSKNFPWSEYTCASAAQNGHLEVLKYLHKNRCPWNASTCSEAARNGYLEVLKYARSMNCPWSEWTCSNATKGGHLEVLKWAHQNGCPWNQNRVRLEAQTYNRQEVLQWLDGLNQP